MSSVTGFLPPEGWQAVRLTLLVAAEAVGWALPVALALALLLGRRALPGRPLIDGIVHLPMVLPPVVTGWILLLLWGVHGPFGRVLWQVWGIRLAFTTPGAALATGVMVIPLMCRTIRLSVEAVDPLLSQAAAGLGAGPVDRLLTVLLPLAAPGILAAVVVGYAAALGEFGAVITFAGSIPGETRTVPLLIFEALGEPGGEAAAAKLSAVSIALALAGLAAAELILRRMRPRIGLG